MSAKQAMLAVNSTVPLSATAKKTEELTLLQQGDEQAFARLVRQHHRALLAVARMIVGESEAEEVVQIAWIKAHRALSGFEGRSALRTWLSRIVTNEARMQLRSRRREVFLEDMNTDESHPFEDRFSSSGSWSLPPSDWGDPGPDALLMSEQLGDCIQKLLKNMPDNQRRMLELRDVAGLEFDEICNTIGISASNARVLLHRARARLYQLVEHYQETGEC